MLSSSPLRAWLYAMHMLLADDCSNGNSSSGRGSGSGSGISHSHSHSYSLACLVNSWTLVPLSACTKNFSCCFVRSNCIYMYI